MLIIFTAPFERRVCEINGGQVSNVENILEVNFLFKV